METELSRQAREAYTVLVNETDEDQMPLAMEEF